MAISKSNDPLVKSQQRSGDVFRCAVSGIKEHADEQVVDDQNGSMWCQSEPNPNKNIVNIADRIYFQEAMKTGKVTTSDFLKWRRYYRVVPECITISYPLRNAPPDPDLPTTSPPRSAKAGAKQAARTAYKEYLVSEKVEDRQGMNKPAAMPTMCKQENKNGCYPL